MVLTHSHIASYDRIIVDDSSTALWINFEPWSREAARHGTKWIQDGSPGAPKIATLCKTFTKNMENHNADLMVRITTSMAIFYVKWPGNKLRQKFGGSPYGSNRESPRKNRGFACPGTMSAGSTRSKWPNSDGESQSQPIGSKPGDFWVERAHLVGGLEHVLFFHILGIIIPID